MKIASMDIGTNSIRLMTAIDGDHGLEVVDKFVTITRIGEGVNETGVLSEAAMNRSVVALAEHKERAVEFGAEEIYVMATSAVRDASNKQIFLDRVKDEVGLDIEVISGELEAEIGFKGVLMGTDVEELLVIDIGGGSTELIKGNKKGIEYARSSDVGVVRMTGKHIESDPISESAYIALCEDVEFVLEEAVSALLNVKYDRFVGIGGTASTFATMKLSMEVFDRSKVHNTVVTLDELSEMVAMLKKSTIHERYEIKGLEKKRADVILSGGVIMENVMRTLNIPEMVVSVSDNLEGWAEYKKIKK